MECVNYYTTLSGWIRIVEKKPSRLVELLSKHTLHGQEEGC